MNAQLAETSVLTDKEIIQRVTNGEKELYGLIVRRYNQRLYRVSMSILSDDSEVEDVIQVTYISAYENISRFAFQSAFSTWLTRICINECLLRLKKRKRILTMDSNLTSTGTPPPVFREEITPLTRVLRSELKVVIENAISQLPDKYRTVFVMREIEGMNVAETTQCLDLTEANVKVRLNRAKALLRKSLSPLYQNEDIFHFHLSRCNRIAESVLKAITQTA